MSRMLTLIDAGWESIRSMVSRGQCADALTRVTRLLTLPDLPASLAAEANRLAGELSLEAEQYSRARRHLRAAAALEHTHARTFFLWGLAFERDPQGCDRQAMLRFRLACKLDATRPLYRVTFGRAAIRVGYEAKGVRAILTAVKQAEADIVTTTTAVEGLLEARRFTSARRLLIRTRFLMPENRTIACLWQRLQFETARIEQQERVRNSRQWQDAEFARDGGRGVLPFIRCVNQESVRSDAGVADRCDVVSFPKPHFPRLRAGKAER